MSSHADRYIGASVLEGLSASIFRVAQPALKDMKLHISCFTAHGGCVFLGVS